LLFLYGIVSTIHVLDYLNSLNEAQREAVIRTEGPSLIIAGAGSGKTRVLTYRIAHLLKQGVRPSTILALTFTNKAAKEMKERIAGTVGENLSRYLWMGTFHSIFARILRMEHETAGFPADYTIYDAGDSKSLIRSIIRDMRLDDKVYKPGLVINRISMAKNNLVTSEAYKQSDFFVYDQRARVPLISDIYKEYVKRCKLSASMDFDDLLLLTNMLFRDHPDLLERYQKRFDYLLVDEYQDTNYAQYVIVNKLAALHKNLCVVGDDAQSIYSFRGARIENILSFQRDYPDYKIFKLEQNYRSTQTIVNAANSVISHNQRKISKNVFSVREKGNPIRVVRALTDQEEGYRVAGIIAETQLRDHAQYEDYAILYRTNAQSRIFEEALRKRNIPYRIYGGISFYQRKEIRDLLAYFRVIINPADGEALKRIINFPARGIGDTTLSKLEAAALRDECSIWSIIKALPQVHPAGLGSAAVARLNSFKELIERFMAMSAEQGAFDLARNVAKETGILKELYNDKSPEGVSKYQNLEEMLNAIREFSNLALEEGRPAGIGDYLQEVALLTDQDTDDDKERNRVTLMTVHAAKGLEFKNVFIVGLEKDLFPSVLAGETISREEQEEERRLFYVALTRAKQQVYLTHAEERYRWGKPESCRPSPFISEIDQSFIEYSDRETNRFSRDLPFRTTHEKSFQERDPVLKPPPGRIPVNLTQKIDRLKEDAGLDSPGNHELLRLLPGMMGEHQRFGIGKVLQMEGNPPDEKATVFFQNAGQKQLLLKYARLRIIP